ncbi:MAG TPA: oligosaccharide flippase family protein, partial [Gemmatimonadaceae bacterium]|nr:oligosaccharide flippase family protein [Gemmatimonadaceae bacterium]
MTFATTVVLARLLGNQSFGEFSALYALVALLSLPCKLGFDTSLIRFVPAYSDSPALRRSFVDRSLLTTAAASFVVAAAWVAIATRTEASLSPA